MLTRRPPGVPSAQALADAYRPRVCVVGPGTHFLSGISYYTFALCNSITAFADVSAILMRRLLPRCLYPGRERVGASLSSVRLAPEVKSFDGVDWFWIPSLVRAGWFLIRRRPEVMIFQWWTGTVLHTYLVLALFAKLLHARIVIEVHEALDVGEEGVVGAKRYVDLLAPRLFRQAGQVVVHSAHDRSLIVSRYGIDPTTISIIPHATYSHYRRGATRKSEGRECNLLNFGVIRPFKGVEDLVRAFEAMPPDEVAGYQLTIVGETWEGWTLPAELIARSRYCDRITFVNRYVTDDEVDRAFAEADVVVLPYRRSSQSGPLHVAMNYGLPIVVTAVGGLVEAVEAYAGAVLVEPDDPDALLGGIRRARDLVGTVFPNPRDWSVTAARYQTLLASSRSEGRSETPSRGLAQRNQGKREETSEDR